ncbi:hypothetical protein [Staphylococcus capitis]|uniref:hypothetical protein n=1 Tax=Staphylococcus capitis TaxID=29388 RepID=UPI003D0788F1
MTVTVEQIADYLGVLPTDPNLPALLAAANDLVDADLTPTGKAKCPSHVFDLAILSTVDQLWRRRNAPGGIATWGPDGGTPVYLPNDVLRPVRPLYARYRPLGRAS